MELRCGVITVGKFRIAIKECLPIEITWNNLREATFASHLDRPRFAWCQRPLGDVNVVCPPVGHLAARILEVPAEHPTTLFAIISIRCWTNPHIPIKIVRRFGIFKGTAGGCTTDRNVRVDLLTKSPAVHHRNRGQEFIFGTALLRSHLKYTTSFFHHFADLLALVDR